MRTVRWSVVCVFVCFAAAAESAPLLPTELDSAIRSSMNNHPDVVSANRQSSASASEVKAGEFRWYPQITASYSNGSRSVSSSGGDNSKLISLGIRQSIWDGGRINSAYDISKATQYADSSQEGYAREQIGMRVSDAYFAVVRARAALAVAQKNVEEHQALHSIISRRSDAGLNARSDVVLAVTRLQQAKAILEQVKGQLGNANASYFSVVNEHPPEVMGGVGDLGQAGSLATLIDSAKSRSRVLAKLRYELDAAEANVRFKKAELMPNLYASVNRIQYPQGGLYYPDETRLMVNIEWQNDIALSKRFHVDSAEYKVMGAKSALESADRQISQAVTESWEGLVSAQRRVEELNKYSESALETVSMFRSQFTVGRRSWPDVLNSLQDAYSSKNQLVDAKYQEAVTRLRLAFMVGEFDSYVSLSEDGRGATNDVMLTGSKFAVSR